MIHRILTVVLLLSASALAQNAPTLDETAHFLAGMPVTGVLEPLTHDPAWQEHAQAMNEAWTRKEQQQIWPEVLHEDLISLRISMNSILRFQYFITKEMRTDLGRGNISGTLPILYVFLARLGYTIVDVTHVTTPAEGVKITFRGGEQPQTLYYFKTDLSGGGNSAFLRWCAARGPGLSLLKAASFLMHGDGFSGVRDFLLEHSRVILQDDSGIPLRAFPKGWDVRCYGRYIQHNETFAKYYQPELAALYQRNGGSGLGFAFGYHWQREAGMLMLATLGGGAESSEKTPPIMKALPITPE